MRTGEVCALTWKDIDLKKGTINISHNVYDKKKNKKAFFISAGIIILAAVLLGATYNYYINIKYNGYKIEERSSIKNKNSASYACYNDYKL